jgi:predicted metal-binding membrane protein
MAGVEGALARHQRLSLLALAGLVLLAWGWLLLGAGMGMAPMASLGPAGIGRAGASDDMMAVMMLTAGPWTAGQFAVTFAMWWVMMVAMMLPSAAPTILLYARAVGHRGGGHRPATDSFLLGYLLVWGLFSLLATSAQWRLSVAAMLSPMAMATPSRWLSALILIAAGAYQISSLKDACLRQCRNPAQFLSRHYRPGRAGALRMGLIHGAWCVGCCWMLMALLFVGGIMNLLWIALLTLLVAMEKLLPWGRATSVAAGLACVVGGWMILLH